MARGPHRLSPQPIDPFDWDAAMARAMQHETAASVCHQLEVERNTRARMERADYFFSLGVLGLAFGVGYGVGGLRLRRRRSSRRKKK